MKNKNKLEGDFLDFASDGELESLESILSQKIIDINAKDRFGHTTLIRATRNKQKSNIIL